MERGRGRGLNGAFKSADNGGASQPVGKPQEHVVAQVKRASCQRAVSGTDVARVLHPNSAWGGDSGGQPRFAQKR
eukprot:3732508-Rhodomonas_salina.2